MQLKKKQRQLRQRKNPKCLSHRKKLFSRSEILPCEFFQKLFTQFCAARLCTILKLKIIWELKNYKYLMTKRFLGQQQINNSKKISKNSNGYYETMQKCFFPRQ